MKAGENDGMWTPDELQPVGLKHTEAAVSSYKKKKKTRRQNQSTGVSPPAAASNPPITKT